MIQESVEMSIKTVAEVMVTELQKISSALDELRSKGLPMSLIMAYLQKKTHLPQKDIKAVLDGLAELNREVKGLGR